MIDRLLASTILAGALLAAPALAQNAPDAPVATDNATDTSGDIVVTATKRNESLRDVAMPISAVTGDQLAKANANSLADYITRLPGVVFNDYQPGISEVVIRGIAATTYHEQGQTTVGYYLNEIPLVEPGFPIGIPDIDTFDLDRVEVLRGPQGTLFGSSTLGGAVNYVVKTADTSGFHAAAQGLIGSTLNADKVNYAGKAMINVPIIADKLAVRVMALQRYDAGYLDNPVYGDEGVNSFRTRGLRGSIVLEPAAGTKITYLATYQDTKLDDQTYVTFPGELIRAVQRAEPQETSFLLNSLRLEQDIGEAATLTVFGSVNHKDNTTYLSYPSPYATGVTEGPDTAYSLGVGEANIKQVEGRLASAGNGPLRWLIGSSYMRATKNTYDQIIQPGAQAAVGAVLAPNDKIYGYISDTLNEDFGVFGEVSYRPVPEFEVLVGGRYYNTRAQGTVVNEPGFIGGLGSSAGAGIDQREDGFLPKASISFRPSSNFLAYMTYSKGYRVGGINPNGGLLPGVSDNYASDKVNNYEAGVKTGLFDNKLLIDATVFTIDWTGIQARLFGPAPSYFSYVTNAGSANVTGVELSATVKPVRNFSLSSNATYQDAALNSFLPDTFAPGGGYASGTTLPGSSRWSVASTATLDFPDMKVAPTFEIAHRYISEAPVAFGNPLTRGNFSLFDARASVTVMERFRVLGFVNNIFDKRGILNAPFADAVQGLYSVTRPRNYGLRVDVGF